MYTTRLGAVCALTLAAVGSAQRDNVLVIIADDLGVDNVAVYAEGPNPPPTPNIDALAARGVLFRNGYANMICSPTRACLQTGRYSTRTLVGSAIVYPGSGSPPAEHQNVLQLAETTLPELLDVQQSGYRHAMIGKWHLGDHTNGGELGPNLAGWLHFAGIMGGTTYFRWPRNVNGTTSLSTTYITTQQVDDAFTWMLATPEPWVVYLAFNAPHKPFHAPPAHLHTRQLTGLTPATDPIEFYRAMVESMDTEMGRLLGSMGSLLDRTNVIFVGDNGTSTLVSEAPFVPSHGKGTPYEGGMNVPFIVAGPAVQSGGREETALVSTVDIFATIAELCGVQPRVPFTKIDGVSFLRHLQAPRQPPARDYAFGEVFSGTTSGRGSAGIRDDRFKLVRWFTAGVFEELYDLSVDPFETNDLLDSLPLSATAQRHYDALAAEFDAIRATTGGFASYGALSCTGSNGTPAIGATGTPMIGSAYTVTLQGGAQAQPAALLIGASGDTWAGLALPFPMVSIAGGPGCYLYASGEFSQATGTTALGAASVRITLPSSPVLAWGELFHSWLIVDPAAPNNPLGITASNGGVVTVGK